MSSCSNCDEKCIIDNLKAKELNTFMGISIESRKKQGGKYIAYKFIKEWKDRRFTLPNFNYYSETQIKDPKLFDVTQYAAANNIKEKDALDFVRNYSSAIMKEYESMGVYKIFSSHKEGEFIIFFIDEKKFVAYVSDKNQIYSEFWKEKLSSSKEIELHWLLGEY
jgi:hypothetical protein